MTRIVSGMRPTGALHLGHYHGVLKNWTALQAHNECYFCIVDWHALTTHYDEPQVLNARVFEMAVDWLAVGVNPEQATMFVQSQVPAHAELHVLLSMITPLSWLLRIPTYKDQQEKLKDRDLSTYGFLGYPLLQAADVLIYKGDQVPVGEDQVAHIEIIREIARRFNFIYGREPDFAAQLARATAKLSKSEQDLYAQLSHTYQQTGDETAKLQGEKLIEVQTKLSESDRELLAGHLLGRGKMILKEPQVLLTAASKLPGLDGQKMSKSYHNTISLRESNEQLTHKIKTMPTDPARVRRTDPGEPEKCPVWEFHKVYSNAETKTWVQEGCRGAKIGCLDCKMPVLEAIKKELAPIQEKIAHFEVQPKKVAAILADGRERASVCANETLRDVRAAMGIAYNKDIK